MARNPTTTKDTTPTELSGLKRPRPRRNFQPRRLPGADRRVPLWCGFGRSAVAGLPVRVPAAGFFFFFFF